MPQPQISPTLLKELNELPFDQRVEELIKDTGTANPLMHSIVRHSVILQEVLNLCPSQDRYQLMHVENHRGETTLALARRCQQAYEVVVNLIPKVKKDLPHLELRSLCKISARQGTLFSCSQAASHQENTDDNEISLRLV